MSEKKKTGKSLFVEPTHEGSIGKTKPEDMVDAVYVGAFSGISIDKFGLFNWPRGEPCKVPAWFRDKCVADKNPDWEFPKTKAAAEQKGGDK